MSLSTRCGFLIKPSMKHIHVASHVSVAARSAGCAVKFFDNFVKRLSEMLRRVSAGVACGYGRQARHQVGIWVGSLEFDACEACLCLRSKLWFMLSSGLGKLLRSFHLFDICGGSSCTLARLLIQSFFSLQVPSALLG